MFDSREGPKKCLYSVIRCSVRASLFIDFGDGMHHGCVVLATELPPDLRKGRFGHLFGHIHGDLTRY